MGVYNYLDFSGMVNIGVGDFKKNANELALTKNVQQDGIGVLRRVPGYSKATSNNAGATANITFLKYYYQPSLDTNFLICGIKASGIYYLKYRLSGEWLDITNGGNLSGVPNANISAENYLDKCFVVGYDPTTDTYVTNTTLVGTDLGGGGRGLKSQTVSLDTDLTNMPQGRYIVKYRDLLYVLYAKVSSTVYPSRAYFSKDPVNQAIPAWDTTLNFLSVGQDDGDRITGGASCCDRLIIFKNRSMWSWDETNLKKIADVGCDSYKSIQVINGILYWANRNGIWRWNGSLPQLITGKVKPLFDYLPGANLSGMVGVDGGMEYRLYIGTLTLYGTTLSNCWIVFDINTETYHIRCTVNSCFSAEKYVEGDNERIYFGSSTGYVYKQSKYQDGVNSDDGNEIDYFFTTNYLDFGAPQITQHCPNIYFFAESAVGMKFAADVDKRGDFQAYQGHIGEPRYEAKDIEIVGNRIAFKFFGKDSGTPFKFEGFVLETSPGENS